MVMTLPHRYTRALAAMALALPTAQAALAADLAGACSSDGRPPPTVVVERFLPDTCTACWSRPTPAADRSALAIDWIVPSPAADAPLAAAALPEAAERLVALGYSPETPEPQFWKWRHPVVPARAGRLRVAHGPAVNDYIGVSMAWTATAGDDRPLDAWLLMVEELPAGTAGSPSSRRLVRAALSVEHIALEKGKWDDRRAMHVPPGADPAHLRLIGWMADQRGEIVAAAASRCAP